MDTLDGMRTFVTVVQEGSFSAAARRLDRSPQLVSKHVAQLEKYLGTRLLNRSTRRLSLTEAGTAYAGRARVILDEIDDMEGAVTGMTARAQGTLRVNAPMSFGISELSAVIADYQREQPDVDVDLTLNDRVIDVVAEGFDVAVRIGQLRESALIARKLAPVDLVLCAAPAYLERHGEPASPDDLAGHNCLAYAYAAERREWAFERDGRQVRVPVRGNFRANNGDALCRAAVAGAGVILQPAFIVDHDLRRDALRPLLDAWHTPALGVYAVFAHRQFLSAKVRTFVDFLAARYAGKAGSDAAALDEPVR